MTKEKKPILEFKQPLTLPHKPATRLFRMFNHLPHDQILQINEFLSLNDRAAFKTTSRILSGIKGKEKMNDIYLPKTRHYVKKTSWFFTHPLEIYHQHHNDEIVYEKESAPSYNCHGSPYYTVLCFSLGVPACIFSCAIGLMCDGFCSIKNLRRQRLKREDYVRYPSSSLVVLPAHQQMQEAKDSKMNYFLPPSPGG